MARHGREEVAVVLDVPTKLENTVSGTVRAMLHIKYHWDSVAWLGWLAGWRARLDLSPRKLMCYHTCSYVMGYYAVAIWIHLEIVPLRRTRSCTILSKALEYHAYMPQASIIGIDITRTSTARPLGNPENLHRLVNFAPTRTFIYLFPNTRSG